MFNNKNKDEDKPQKVAFFKRRSFKYGSLATGFTAVFIALLVLVNVGVSWASNRFPINVDLTASKTYKINTQSVNYAKTIKQKISIDILATKAQYMKQSSSGTIIKILEQYPQYNSNITINYVDMTANPTYQANYPKETLGIGDLIVRNGNDASRYKHISYSDMIVTSTDSNTDESYITGYDAEQQVDSALAYITTNDFPTIELTTGHGETDSTAMQALLTKNNYKLETTTISSQGIDKNAKMLMIVDPKNDFSSDDIKKIDDFIQNGGERGKSLMVFFDPQQSTLPNLENYIKEWGISVGQGVVYDKTNSVSGNNLEVLSGDYDSTVLGNLTSGENASLFLTRPLEPLFGTKSYYTTSTLLSSQPTSRLWNTPTLTQEAYNSFNPSDSDKQGPFKAMMKSAYTAVFNNVSTTSNLIVSGTTYSFNDSALLSEASATNADAFLNTVNNTVGFKSPISVVSKSTDSTQLNIPTGQQRFIAIFFIVILPVFVLLLGLIIWLRRRHL